MTSRDSLLQYKLTELKNLAYDIQNATQVLALKNCTERLYNIIAHLVYAVTDETPQVSGSPRAAANPTASFAPSPAPTPPPPTPAPQPTVYPPGYHVTPGYQQRLVPPVITQPVNMSSPIPVSPEIPPSDKMNVVITPQGTTVIPPIGGAPMTLPPNTPVDLPSLMDPAVPPPAPPGVLNVVLPRGGVMPTEVTQSLQAASEGVPVIPQE